jgi:hypothetical protein
MFFQVPEAYSVADGPPTEGVSRPQQFCRSNFAEEADGTWGRTFALPTLEELLIACREQYNGDWIFDDEVERFFTIVFQDASLNVSVIQTDPFILNPVTPIDWSLYPSTIALDYAGQESFTWSSELSILKEESAPYFDFERIKNVSIGVPVAYSDSSSTQVTTMCYVRIPDGDFWVNNDNELELALLDFYSLAFEELPDCNDAIPDYQHNMLGETQTAVPVYLWTQETVSDFTEVEKAFEVLHININLPPEVIGHTITRVGGIELDINTLHNGDIVHPSILNSLNLYKMFWRVNLPESFDTYTGPSNSNWCYVPIEADTNGVLGESVTVPSSSQIYTRCHSYLYGLDGDWTFDESVSRRIQLMTYDSADNEMDYELTLAAKTQAPEPDRTAPPTTEPTPPEKNISLEPTPPTPEPPAPPAPLIPDQKVITPEPVVVEVVTPVKVIEDVEIEVATEVSIKSESLIAEKPIKIALVAKVCAKAGVWIFTKNNLLQICDTKLSPVLVIPACTGREATPTFPGLFKAQRFKPGYSTSASGQKLYYSVFFFKGLSITGVDKVLSAPCSNGSVFIEKKYAKQVYDYIAKNKSLIWVKS